MTKGSGIFDCVNLPAWPAAGDCDHAKALVNNTMDPSIDNFAGIRRGQESRSSCSVPHRIKDSRPLCLKKELRPLIAGLIVMACAIVGIAPVAMGQQPAAGPAEKKAEGPLGLDALPADALLTELANRRQTILLSIEMNRQKLSQSQQLAYMSLVRLRSLEAGEHKYMSDAQRRQYIQQAADAMEAALPELADPRLLMLESSLIVSQGIAPDLNTLEYWGDSPTIQAPMLPLAKVVDHLLLRAEELCAGQLKQLSAQITSPDDDYSRQYMQVDRTRTIARYTRAMSAYAMVLAMDQASDQRKSLCTSTLEALAEYDNAESTVQPLVRLQMGKLLLARGQESDAKQANDLFASIISQQVSPEPTIQQQYQARYFSLLAKLQTGDLDGAQAGLAELQKWQNAQIPEANSRWAQGAQAAMHMLHYRILMARAAGESDVNRQQAYRDSAMEQLAELMQAQPSLRPVIQQQWVAGLASNTQVTTLPPLMLEALVNQATQMLAQGETLSHEQLMLALAAAQQLGQIDKPGGIDPVRLAEVQRQQGVLLEQLGKPSEAIEAYLKFVTENSTDASAGQTLSRAIRLSWQLWTQSPDDLKVLQQFTTVLKVAVQPPFSQVELAYVLGRVLQQQGDFSQAADAYALVPAGSAEAPAARYFRIVAIGEYIDLAVSKGVNVPRVTLTTDAIKQLVQQLRQLADGVRQSPSAENPPPSTTQPAAQEPSPREYDVRALIAAADELQQLGDDPQHTLDLLKDVESQLAELKPGKIAPNSSPPAQVLLGHALQVRVNAYMSLKQNMQATQSLVRLLESRQSGEGSRIIYDLLRRLGEDQQAASLAGDLPSQRSIALARATLSEYLVKWAAGNPDETIRRNAYQYRLFDADAQHQAAGLVEDPRQRDELLAKSLAGYQLLATPAQVAEYQKVWPAWKGPPGDADPNVQMGLASVMYDQGNYRLAQPIFGKLLLEGRLGGPRIVNGNDITNNEPYWEATLKLYRCNIALAKDDGQFAGALEETKSGLARLYIRDGESVGGKKWHAEFETLRKELLPDMQLSPAATGPSTKP